MKYGRTIQGTFIDRPNRFIANVKIDGTGNSNPVVRVHVKNTGRCREILVPGARVVLVEGGNPSRSTRYDLVAVWKGDVLINIDSQAPNLVAKEGLEKVLGPLDLVKAEQVYGDSRIDLYAEKGDRRILVEVKGVTLEFGGTCLFPDAPTKRGVKHVRELVKARKEGYEAYLLFVVQMGGMELFSPNFHTHREFGEALREAEKAGVGILAFECDVEPDSMELSRSIPVDLVHNHSEKYFSA